jgi:hypothetical protein
LNCVFYQFDDSFDGNRTLGYRLAVLLHQEGFAFCCLDVSSQTVIGLAEYREEISAVNILKDSPALYLSHLKEAFSSVELYSLPFNSVVVAIAGKVHALVPQMLVTRESARKLLSFNFEIAPEDVVITDQVEGLDACNLFSCKEGVLQLLNSLKSNPKIRSSSSVLIESLLTLPVTKENRTPFYLNYSGNLLDIVWINKNSIEYCNSFYIAVPEDLLYYLIFVIEQLGFDTESSEIMLSGDINTDSVEITLLKKYFTWVTFLTRPGGMYYSPKLSQVETHHFYTLFNLLLCES